MSAPPRVCLVTPGHLSTNPRLVKEADALHAAGCRVRVVATKFAAWADRADGEFLDRPWPTSWARFGPLARWPGRQAMRLRRRILRPLALHAPRLPGVAALAFHDVVPQLARLAALAPADLYIAHNLAALPAAVWAARRHGARVGFDAEDFHRGELAAVPANEPARRLTAGLEARYMPCCAYVTAASDGIARAYAEALGIACPTTILNSFPLAERQGTTPPDELARERHGPGLSLYWYSQTIGPDRGLEDALRAMASLGTGVRLHLRGSWADGYETTLLREARRLGVADRVHHLPPAPPGQLVERAARHDVGLALEVPATTNRDLCVTNKILVYLLAGLGVAATDTAGQREVLGHVPGAGFLYPAGNADALAACLRPWLAADGALAGARATSRLAGERRFCWEIERKIFLGIVHRALAQPLNRATAGACLTRSCAADAIPPALPLRP